jgi:magnesium transporter
MREAVRSTLWEISARLDAGETTAALHYLTSLHPADQADILSELNVDERRLLLDQLEADQLARVLEHLTPGEIEDVAPHLELGEIAAALGEVSAGTAADVLHQLNETRAEAVLSAMGDRSQVEPLLEHEDESAGGIMSPAALTLRPDQTADNAIDYLRAVGRDARDPYYLYVVDAGGRLEGVVGLRDLVVARPDRRIRDLMNAEVITVEADADQEIVLQTLQHYNLRAIPVVDADGLFVGVTTADDLIDVAQQEATEDMFRMVGLGTSEELRGAVAGSVGRRLPWLLVNLLTVFAAAATVSAFEETLERAAVLAVFLPVVVGIGANAGGQTLTLVVRGIALGSFEGPAWQATVSRELLIATINGLVLGLLVAIAAWLWKGNAYLGLAIGLAMLANLLVAGLAGVLVPATLRRLGADPALASSIFVTSVTDIMGYFFYLGVAVILIDRIA